MTNEKIDAALAVLRTAPDDAARIGGADDWLVFRTGLTFADLRELLEAARDDGWRDAESDKPPLGKDVAVEYGGIARSGWLSVDGWIIRDDEHGPWVQGAIVRRWRELPR